MEVMVVNINKCKISNLNKKLIAGLLAITLAAPLVGCNNAEQNYGLEYTIDSEGRYVYQNATFNSLKNCKVVVFECGEERIVYLTEVVSYTHRYGSTTHYYNIFGGQQLYWINSKGSTGSSSMTIEKEFSFTDYLVINGEVQQEYTEQELKDILEQIKADYELQNDKQLVKE